MMHGWTEPSSTLHPYAFAIAPHNITDPIGANANATIRKSAIRIILDDTLGNSKRRRLIAKVPPSRVLLRLKLAAMLFAFFQRYKTNDKKRNHGAHTDKSYNGDYADRPFKYG